MKCEKKCMIKYTKKCFLKLKDFLFNLEKESYNITGIISVLTATIGTIGMLFGNITLLSLSPILLLVSFHCHFLMENKI